MTANDNYFCQRCGSPVQRGDKFCGECGARVALVTPEDSQVIPEQVVAAQGATARSHRKALFLAGALGVLLLLVVGGGAMALLGSGGEEIELSPGVYSKVPEGWAVAASTGDGQGMELVPQGYQNKKVENFGDSVEGGKASQEEASIMASGTNDCTLLETGPGGDMSYEMEEITTGYNEWTTVSRILADGDATVAEHPATWEVVYSASSIPWTTFGSTTAADYPNYQNMAYLNVCVEDLDLSVTMNLIAILSRPPNKAPEDEPTLERNALVPAAREEVHDELRQRYDANVGAMMALLSEIDAGGLFNGRTDLDEIPTSLKDIDEALSDPFDGELQDVTGTSQEPEEYDATEPTTSSSTASEPSWMSEEEIAALEEFGREYDEAVRREDWEATYWKLHESSQQRFTEEEWSEKQQALMDASGPPAPLESVTVEQEEQATDVPVSVVLHYEDGAEETMTAGIPMAVEDPSESGVPKRFLTEEEIAELEQLSTSGTASPDYEGVEAEAEEATEDYYEAAGRGDWEYTYNNLDAETQSKFTREEWFKKNQWFADNGEVIYHIESVRQVGTSSEFFEVTLTLTYADGSSSTRTTYFIYEDGAWKHRFRQEEYDLFMPDLSFEEFVEAQGGTPSRGAEEQDSPSFDESFPEDFEGEGEI